jgi:hypothetical protein
MHASLSHTLETPKVPLAAVQAMEQPQTCLIEREVLV